MVEPGTHHRALRLALSVIFRPDINELPQIMMLGALAITDMLHTLGATNVAIKWPNDVLLNGCKVSGVLPETTWEGDTLLGVALGIGVNVRMDFSETELAQTAISIEPALNITVDRNELVATLVKRIDYWSARLGSNELFEVWQLRLNTLGQEIRVGDIAGIAEGVDKDGTLLVRDKSGQLRCLVAGVLS